MYPEITVLMSVYNGERFLREAIESILNQSYSNFEFLIINDASTDSSRDIILSYKDKRIRLMDNEQNIGLTRSLNSGLTLARGKYIARMDADDISMPERFEKQIRLLNNNHDIGLTGTYYQVITDNKRVIEIIMPPTDNYEIKTKLSDGSQFCHGSVMFLKECIEKVGPYKEIFKSAQDYDLWLRISQKYNVANIPEPLYQWRFHLNSVSMNRSSQNKYAAMARFLNDPSRKEVFLETEAIEKTLGEIENKKGKRQEISFNYYYWGLKHYDGKDFKNAFELTFKSILYNPINNNSFILLLKILFYWGYTYFKPLYKKLKEIL